MMTMNILKIVQCFYFKLVLLYKTIKYEFQEKLASAQSFIWFYMIFPF